MACPEIRWSFCTDFASLILLVQYQPARDATISQRADVCKKVCAAGLAQRKQSSYKTEGVGGGFEGGRGENIILFLLFTSQKVH